MTVYIFEEQKFHSLVILLLNTLKDQENQNWKTIIGSNKGFCFKMSDSKLVYLFILPKY